MNDELILGIVGAGGYAREVAPILKQSKEIGKLVFVTEDGGTELVNGLDVLSESEFFLLKEKKLFNVAIADSKLREKISDVFELHGCNAYSIIDRTAVIMDRVLMGDGAIISPFVTLTSNIEIGKSFHANIYSYVAHDCRIGNFVTFAPRVCCNGNTIVEDHAYVGTGAIIKHGTPEKPIVIGKGAVVGMGAVVTKSVAPNTIVVGNPAKPLNGR